MSEILQVIETYQETEDSRLINFGVPKALRKQYAYQPGQFITLETQIYGKSYRRPYSICGIPRQEDSLSIVVKRVRGGAVSNYLNDFAELGASFRVHAPQGNFKINPWLLNTGQHVFFAAGCGITPVISMIESLLKKEMFSKVILFYSSKTWENAIFRDRLKALWEAYPKRFNFQMIFTSSAAVQDAVGRLNQEKIGQLLTKYLKNPKKSKYFLCGPTGFMEEVMSGLLAMQVPAARINYESFTGSQLTGSLTAPAALATSLPAISTAIEVIIDKKLHAVSVDKNQMILDSVLLADLDANYSCRAGNCGACKAKLISGQVSAKPSPALSKKEVSAGYILTCQSQPASEGVKVEYCM